MMTSRGTANGSFYLVMEELWTISWSRVDKTTLCSSHRRVRSLWDL